MSRDEGDTTADVAIGPGTQLRKARERLGLDQAKMASQLHLSQAMIVALESDDFDNLPGPVFVQGYLRKYSRLLGVNEDAVVEAYQNLFPVSDELPIAAAQTHEMGRDLHSGSGLVRYVTWGILLLMVGLVLYWWLTRVELDEPVSMPAQEQELLGPEDLAVEQAVVAPTPAVQELAQTPPPVRVVEESEQVLSEIDEVLSSSNELLGPAAEERPQTVEIETPVTVTPVQAATPVEKPRLEQTSDRVSRRVVFQFSEPCWTEVRDQNGKLRIYGEISSGRVRTLDSRLGPFSVLLGNAIGVKLTIDGEPFDLEPFTRGKVARFTLDPQRL
ncbi:MAG: RodZ domain-containing protein [Candidatus Thiodiazotropha sp.]